MSQEHPITGFATQVTEELPENWTVEEFHAQKTEGKQVAIRRDDDLAIIFDIQGFEMNDWPPVNIGLHIPSRIGAVPDRPGEPFHTVECSVDSVVKCIQDNSPEEEL